MLLDSADLKSILVKMIFRDSKIFKLILVYGITVAILNLTLPLSIQILINSIIYTALIQPIIILGIVLLFLLAFSGILSILQKYLVEMYKRKSFVDLSSRVIIQKLSGLDSNDKPKEINFSSRYFEIFNIQNHISVLITEGLLIILTILISMLLSSFYHPFFLLINLVIISLTTLSWKFLARTALKKAIVRSEAKFSVFDNIDQIFTNSIDSTINPDLKIEEAHSSIQNYIDARKQYWQISITLTIILTVIYVTVTILLLTLGSYFVIKNQLSLGQLIAAEILYTNSLLGLAKLGNYFDKYFSLLASIEELNYILDFKSDNNQNK